MSLKLFRSLIVIFIIQSSQLLLAGGMDRGGSDYSKWYTNKAWFPGKKEITYCYIIDKNFGVDSVIFENELTASANIWQNYIKEKIINWPGSRGTGPQADKHLFMKLVKSQTFKDSRNCDGKEDITFYLGVTNKVIETNLMEMDHPVGFAVLTEENKIDINQRGIVWFANERSIEYRPYWWGDAPQWNIPDWKYPYILRGMILHELGHILGCNHKAGTIMSPRIYDAVGFASRDDRGDFKNLGIDMESKVYSTLLGTIDSSVELVSPWTSEKMKFQAPPNPQWQLAYEKLTNIANEKVISVTFEITGPSIGSTEGELNFQIVGEKGNLSDKKFKLSLGNPHPMGVYYDEEQRTQFVVASSGSTHHSSSTYAIGTIETPSGNKTVSFAKNTSFGFDDYTWGRSFQAKAILTLHENQKDLVIFADWNAWSQYIDLSVY